MIYNSPYYGFATRADLFFALRAEHPNLIGFKEFGGPADMRYAAENITSRDDDVSLMIGVDTAVVPWLRQLRRDRRDHRHRQRAAERGDPSVQALARRRPPAMPRRASARWSWSRRSPSSRPSTKVPTSSSTSST